MVWAPSDPTAKTCQDQRIRTVREYLRAHGEVAAKDEIRAGTDVPAWYITQISTERAFYTSLNHYENYVGSEYIVGRRSTHEGFWRPEVDNSTAVFYRKETTKATLEHLTFRRPSPSPWSLLPSRFSRRRRHRDPSPDRFAKRDKPTDPASKLATRGSVWKNFPYSSLAMVRSLTTWRE